MKRINSSYGYTLLEVLFSMVMLSVGILGVANAFATQLSFNTRSQIKSSAIMAAQQVLDEIRVQDPTSLPSSGSSSPVTVDIGGKPYFVTITYCQNTTYCSAPTIRVIRADVVHNGQNVFSTETVYAQLR